MAEEYGYEITLKAQLARRIDAKDQAREFEETARCDGCNHLVAVINDGPLSGMPPVCQNCMAEEMETLTHTIKTLEEQRSLMMAQQHKSQRKIKRIERAIRWNLLTARVILWVGGVVMGVLMVLNIQDGAYVFAVLDGAIVVGYIWLFWRSFRRKEV